MKRTKAVRRCNEAETSFSDIFNFYCFSNLKWAICISILLTCFLFIFEYGRTFYGPKQIIFFVVLCIAIGIRVVILELFVMLVKTIYLALTTRQFPEDNYRAAKQKDLSNIERVAHHLNYLHDKLALKNTSPFTPLIYERRTFFYSRLIYEFFLISIPTIILAVLLIFAKDKEIYYAKNVVSKLINYNALNNISARTTRFTGITNQIYKYLNHTALPALHGILNYDGTNRGHGWVRDEIGKLQGIIRLRQQRHIYIKNCPVPSYERAYIKYNSKCAKYYNELKYDTKNYSSNWQKYKVDSLNDSYVSEIPMLREPYIFRDAVETQAIPLSTVHRTYDGSGYTVGLGRTIINSGAILNYLKNSHWIDNQTMVLFLEFSILNVNKNLLMVNTVIIENFLAGDIETHLIMRVVRLAMLARNLKWAILIWILICFAALLWYIFYLFKRLMVSSFGQIVGNIWNIFDMIIVALVISMSILFIIRDSKITNIISVNGANRRHEYKSYHGLAEYERLLFLLAGICIFLSVLRLWRALQFSLMFRIFTVTIEKAKWALFNTAVNIIIFAIAFTLVVGLLTGSSIELFHDLLRGVPAILSSSYELQSESRIQDVCYSVLLGIVTIYFVNMFVVCLLYYFDAAKNEVSYEVEYVSYSFFSFIINTIKGSLYSCKTDLWVSSLFASNSTKTRLSRLRGGGQLLTSIRTRNTIIEQKDKYRVGECPKRGIAAILARFSEFIKKLIQNFKSGPGTVHIIENQFRQPSIEKYSISEQILDTQFLFLKTFIDDEIIDCYIGAETFLDFFQQAMGDAVVRDDPLEVEEYYIPAFDPKEPC